MSRTTDGDSVVHEMNEDHTALSSLLAVLYGLSSAEERLALRLYEGQSLQQAACTFGVSVETVRVQVKSIFRKTGVHGQTELIRLLKELSRS